MPPKLPVVRPPRPFRILALPLARIPPASPTPPPPPPASASPTPPPSPSKPKTPLLLFHVSQPDPPPKSASSAGPSYQERALQKASDMWLKLGEKDKNSWMFWFYKRGEGLMDRIEYEEWALKGVVEGRGVRIAKEGEEQKMIEIQLLKPALDPALPTLVPKLHRLLIHRIPFHRKMMMRSLIFSPLTWPFAIIPIIPNFPLFYVLWRAWSHYRAWRGALYLEQLLQRGMIKEVPSDALTEVYESKGMVVAEKGSENLAPDTTSSPPSVVVSEKASTSSSTPGPGGSEAEGLPGQAKGEGEGAQDGTATPRSMVYEPSPSAAPATKDKIVNAVGSSSPAPRHPALLLTPSQVPLLARAFDFRPNEVVDLNRAVEQAEARCRAADTARRQEQKQEREQGKKEDEGKDEPPTKWRGNLHR